MPATLPLERPYFLSQVALSHTMHRIKQVAEKQFKFFPRTWALPGQLNEFRVYYNSLQHKKTFIIKPSAGCQGMGLAQGRGERGGARTRGAVGTAGLQDLRCCVVLFARRPTLGASLAAVKLPLVPLHW